LFCLSLQWSYKYEMTSKTNGGKWLYLRLGSIRQWYKQHRQAIVNHRWRCPVTTCRKTQSLRHGSFFEKSKLSLQKWLVLLHWWIREYPVIDAAEEAKVTEATAIQVYQYFRDICSWRLLTHDSPMLLGGPCVVVEIDESLLATYQRYKHKKIRGQTYN
jgi:hypothetical protein